MAKTVKVTIEYPWVGIDPEEIYFTTDADNSLEIDAMAYEEAIEAIFNNISWSYEIEEDDEDERYE